MNRPVEHKGLPPLSRRRLLQLGAASAGSLLLAGCDDSVSENPSALAFIDKAEALTYRAQRLILPPDKLAVEYSESDIAPQFRANGSINPAGKDYRALASNDFADWRLGVDGLVEKPMQLSLTDLRALPTRTQITRHDCVEGWSCIGKWTGTPLSEVLKLVGTKPQAKFVVLHCADKLNYGAPNDLSSDPADSDTTNSFAGSHYYESIDLVDAYHPQTILAYELNGASLPIAHGAPLRLRVERQLGYKMAKYVMRIEIVESFRDLGQGKGGYWEDLGYEWYAGI
jgi:DMSO/TMAO reductase YedYZ molybdopterin-dependent catalytic subunit